MNQYIYARENIKKLVFVAFIIGLPILVVSILAIIDFGWIGYCFLGGLFVLLVILFIFSINALKWRKWNRKLKKFGTKVSGTVVDFGYSYRKANLRVDPSTPPIEEHWLKVQYVDVAGAMKEFNTPALSFKPEKRKDVICDVYIYNGEVLATGFKNLKKG